MVELVLQIKGQEVVTHISIVVHRGISPGTQYMAGTEEDGMIEGIEVVGGTDLLHHAGMHSLPLGREVEMGSVADQS